MEPYTLGAALTALLKHTAARVADGSRSASTLHMQEGHARWWLSQLPAATPMADLDEVRLEDIADNARLAGGTDGRPLNVRTIAKRMSTLRRAFNVAVRRRLVDRVPLFPEFQNPAWRPRYRVLETHADLRRLCAELPPKRALWVHVAFWTCQHASDVERMTWANVGDLETDKPWMQIRNTKNRKTWLFRVRCPRELVAALIVERNRLEALGQPPLPSTQLVQDWPNRYVQTIRACARAGLNPLSANDLRHSGISAMVQRIGLTPGAQKWGGWSSFAMMEKHYAHALPAALEECAAELDAWADKTGGVEHEQ